MANPVVPQISGQGLELTGELWNDLIVVPLIADSVVMGLEGANLHATAEPFHIPILGEAVTDETVWASPGGLVAEFEGVTSQLTLMSRSLKACKILVKISSESMRSSDALGSSQVMIVNQMRKIVDKALLQGDATAGIAGLLPQAAANTVKHSRSVADGVTASSTTVTSATAAFTSADVGSFVTGGGIPADATIASVTNATTIILSAAATATATAVALVITTNYAIYDRLVDALTAAQSNYANPTTWVIEATCLGMLRKLKDTLGRPLLSPDTQVAGMDALLGRTAVVAPGGALPHGTAMLVDPRGIHIAVDLAGSLKLALEAFIANDEIGILIASRFDIGITLPACLQVIDGLSQ